MSTFTRYFFSVTLIGSFLYAQKAPLVSLQERNKQADAAFLRWRLDAPGSTISQQLKEALTSEVIGFIVTESQLPLDRFMSKKDLQDKVRSVTQQVIKKFEIKKEAFKQRELETLISKIILPEYEFQINPHVTSISDKAYNKLLRTIRQYKTKVGTFLDIWTLRFLTSEAQFVALEMIAKDSRKGRHFNTLSVPDQRKILQSASKVVTRRFMRNLLPAKKRLGFEMPPHASMAVKGRVDTFLREKFL